MSSTMRGHALLVLLALLVPRSAFGFELSWDAPEGCPAATEIQTDVARIVGSREKRPVTVRAVAREVDRTWSVELHTRTGDEDGERVLRGASCNEVATAAVVVIALTIDPDVMTPVATPTPLPTPTPTPIPPPPPPPLPIPRSLFATLRLVGGVSLGIPPGAAPRVQLAAGLRRGRFAARLGGAFAAETSESLPSLPSAGGAFWLLSLEARACAAPIATRRFELWTCGGVDFDRLAARGYGVTNPSTGENFWLAPVVGLEPAIVLIDRLRAVLPLELSFPLDRSTFVIEGIGPVYRPPPVSGTISLGLEVYF